MCAELLGRSRQRRDDRQHAARSMDVRAPHGAKDFRRPGTQKADGFVFAFAPGRKNKTRRV
jgi:hypothetical protein